MGNDAVMIRDHAVFSLLIHYGLRRGEVERLTLDDNDGWRAISSVIGWDGASLLLGAWTTSAKRASPSRTPRASPEASSRR
jgi:integrase